MTLLVMGSTALVLALVETYAYVRTRQMILGAGKETAIHQTRSMTRRIEQSFRAVEKVTSSLALYLRTHPPVQESRLRDLLFNTVKENREIFGSGIFFEPRVFVEALTSFAPYCFGKDNQIEYAQLARPGYNYSEKEFYTIPRLLEKPFWSDPYFDTGGGHIPMATYSVPLFHWGKPYGQAKFQGVVTSDISLKLLTDLTQAVHAGETGFSFMITDTGVFVAHPNESFIMNESIFSRADKLSSPRMRSIGRKMIREEQGFMDIGETLAGEDAYLAWDRIPSSGWILGTVVTHSDLFGDLTRLKMRTIGLGLAGGCLLLFASILVARSIARPLISMVGATQQISRGDLDVDLSHIHRDDEVGRLAVSIEEMAEGLRQKEFIRDTFGRYLTKEVVANLLESKDGLKLGGEAREITLMMSDLRGFTSLTSQMPPEKVISFLNRYLGRMVDILVAHNGVIDEIIGDGILAFFGAPEPMEDHAKKAVACALDMQAAMAQINAMNEKDGLARLEMGIAVHTGTVVVGNIGSETRSKYGAVGSDVNFTGRMESYSVGGQVLVSEAVVRSLGDLLNIKQTLEVRMKGIPERVSLYDVIGMTGSLTLPSRDETPIPLGKSMIVSVRRLNHKTLDKKGIPARLTHTSHTSAVILFTEKISLWEDIRVELPREVNRPDGGEFYGKVVAVEQQQVGWETLVRTTSISSQAYGLFGK